jgi:hypothetical protein
MEWVAYDHLEPVDTAGRVEYANAITVSTLRNLIVSALTKSGSHPKMLIPDDFILGSAEKRFDALFPEESEWGVDTEGKRVKVEEADADTMLRNFLPFIANKEELKKNSKGSE